MFYTVNEIAKKIAPKSAATRNAFVDHTLDNHSELVMMNPETQSTGTTGLLSEKSLNTVVRSFLDKDSASASEFKRFEFDAIEHMACFVVEIVRDIAVHVNTDNVLDGEEMLDPIGLLDPAFLDDMWNDGWRARIIKSAEDKLSK